MAIFAARAMRPSKLCVLGEAAAAVLLARPTCELRRIPIPALRTAAAFFHRLHNPVIQDLGALHCTLSSSRCLHPLDRRCFATSSTTFTKKASLKSGSITKVGAKRKSLGPGKSQKPGRNTKRSVTILASSRQKGEISTETSSRKSSTSVLAKTRSKTALKNKGKSGSRESTQSEKMQNRSSNGRLVNKPAAGSFLRKGSVAGKKASKEQENKDGGPTTGTQKWGKKVMMRLDPEDNTSKRIFEGGYPLPGEDVQQEASVHTTGRVQFRAIVPPPKLLQHIQRLMLGRRRPSELQRAGYDMRITPAPLDNIPYSKKGERQPIQEEVFRHKLRFAAAAKTEASLPPYDIPEVAFAGRSNVGKSSLINALTRQWGVARTSDKPGFTQSINFFRLGGRLCLVDLPGYGFAYAKEEKKEAWEELVREFLTTRGGLKRVYVLVDAKWGLKLRDEELIESMEKAGTRYQIVLTKSDTVTPMDLARRAVQIQEVFKENKSLVLPLIMVSSKTGEGLEFFRANIAKLAKASLI